MFCFLERVIASCFFLMMGWGGGGARNGLQFNLIFSFDGEKIRKLFICIDSQSTNQSTPASDRFTSEHDTRGV
jgi:hypothetical protein